MSERTDDTGPAMTSHRPYLLRALNEWIAANDMTPHLLVDATRPGVQVPAHKVKDGKIVLNIAQRAVLGLQIDNDAVSFTTRFDGVSYPVVVPIPAVLEISVVETRLHFPLPEDPWGPHDQPPPTEAMPAVQTPPRRGHLRVIK